MKDETKESEARDLAAIWIPIGLAAGSACGAFLNDMSMGMSFGLLFGATISAVVEYGHGKRSLVWPIVAAVAFVWTLAVFVVDRT
ncbi:hypothetical protein [Horticoccus sp. 23ND18S-11]|uniref:hypothetical protein n=1 Tax=Horticoccus sp. 23ND18S-11 TaxID=3391832 RepID=UPI0039C9BD0F